jgi:hypothetical protein
LSTAASFTTSTPIPASNPMWRESIRKSCGGFGSDYEAWWDSLAPPCNRTVRYIGLGGAENPMTLSSHDWLMPDKEPAAWHQNHIRRGDLINGPWALRILREGTYEITLHRWPPYLNKAMNMTEARIAIGGVEESKLVAIPDTGATFKVRLSPGQTKLETWLTRPDGKSHGAYYTTIRFVE